MVTSVVNELYDRLVESFPPNRSYTLSDISGDPMPGPVADYLKRELRRRLQRAAPGPDEDNWVDGQHQEVQRARATYLQTLAEHQRIPAERWAALLKRACDETVRVLVRPSSALTEIVFAEGRAVVDPDPLFEKLDYFTAYPYFREVVEAYFEQKGIARIDRDRFEGLINRIDRQMTSDYGSVEWMRLLRPLLSVLRAAGYRNDLPVDVLAAFLDEKGADEPLRRLRQAHGSQGRVATEVLSELFLEDAGDGTDTPLRKTEHAPGAGISREQARSPVPLWKQFEQGAPVSAEERVADSPPRSPGGSSEPLWKQFRSGSERNSSAQSDRSTGDSSLADLEQSVLGSRGARNRELFVRHLFSGNPDEYESTLRKLQDVGSWSEASKVIAQDVFLKHQVNIYSDPAVAFTDAAESRYRN